MHGLIRGGITVNYAQSLEMSVPACSKNLQRFKKSLDSGLWYGHYIVNAGTNQLLQQQ